MDRMSVRGNETKQLLARARRLASALRRERARAGMAGYDPQRHKQIFAEFSDVFARLPRRAWIVNRPILSTDAVHVMEAKAPCPDICPEPENKRDARKKIELPDGLSTKTFNDALDRLVAWEDGDESGPVLITCLYKIFRRDFSL